MPQMDPNKFPAARMDGLEQPNYARRRIVVLRVLCVVGLVVFVAEKAFPNTDRAALDADAYASFWHEEIASLAKPLHIDGMIHNPARRRKAERCQ
ncbi:hypothetical protein [Shimia sp.]|uniref:hypothetical protein n=1 Tax=Shimia sp. TaxID=1954381 RepID=UPI003B8EA572